LRDAYRKTLLLEANPRHPLELLIDGQRLLPIDIGSHDAVYRS
jgi:hypothetical protein